jgi:hypothetical protein
LSKPASGRNKQYDVEEFWNAKSCDSDSSNEVMHSLEYFEDVEKKQYRLHPHIRGLLSSVEFQSKTVFEFGTGVGTDARTIISMNAFYHGIDIVAKARK